MKQQKINLLNLWNSRTPEQEKSGLTWYNRGYNLARDISKNHNISIQKTIGVIAVLSPGCNWDRNLMDAESFIKAHGFGWELPQVGVYGSKNRIKAERILGGERFLDVVPPTSKKVRAFYHCLLHPNSSNHVVIDRHAKAAAYGFRSSKKGFASDDKLSLVRPREYELISDVYREVADTVNLLPCKFQAVLWTCWKEQ